MSEKIDQLHLMNRAVRAIDASEQYISADAMMAYVRITIRQYNAEQTEQDRRTATLTLIFHSLWIAAGVIVASIAARFGVNIYLAIALGGAVSLGQEILDKIKGTG